jgi:hypothetical protein
MIGHKHLFIVMIDLAGTIFFGDIYKVEVKGKKQSDVSPEE